jgi:hypothetical protein
VVAESLLKASLLISLYSVRSERAFCEELTYHLLFRWFFDMDMLEPSFDHSTFSRNRQRLLQHRVSREFFDAAMAEASLDPAMVGLRVTPTTYPTDELHHPSGRSPSSSP